MNINLLPKAEHSKTQFQININFRHTALVIAIAIIVFGFCFYVGFLYNQISGLELKSDQLMLESKCYQTEYRKVLNLESAIREIQTKSNLIHKIRDDYIPPLESLRSLIQLKSEQIWFERLEITGTDGKFILQGGAAGYQAFGEFVAKMEQDKLNFAEVKPKNAAVSKYSTGREFIRFKINGIIVKRSGTNAQNN